MDKDGSEDASQMEINISNTNADNKIVLNDLRLLELIHMYPFLFSKAVRPQGDKDYDKWGWEEIAKAFNISYDGLELSAPFSVEELRWRWETLLPICPTLVKASAQIPTSLRNIIVKIERLMNVKPPTNRKGFSETQEFILNQVSFVEQLTNTQQRQLEVEILDVILTEERDVRSGHKALSKTEKNAVQCEYDEFLREIRVKELPTDSISSKSSVSSNGGNSQDSFLATPSIVNSHDSNLVISSVRCMHDSTNPPTSPAIKAEPPDHHEGQKQERQPKATTDDLKLCYVPLKSAKYYVKKVKVKVKRINLDKFMLSS